jgi:hypothetical protein
MESETYDWNASENQSQSSDKSISSLASNSELVTRNGPMSAEELDDLANTKKGLKKKKITRRISRIPGTRKQSINSPA